MALPCAHGAVLPLPLQDAKEALRLQTAVRYASSGYAFVTFSEQV